MWVLFISSLCWSFLVNYYKTLRDHSLFFKDCQSLYRATVTMTVTLVIWLASLTCLCRWGFWTVVQEEKTHLSPFWMWGYQRPSSSAGSMRRCFLKEEANINGVKQTWTWTGDLLPLVWLFHGKHPATHLILLVQSCISLLVHYILTYFILFHCTVFYLSCFIFRCPCYKYFIILYVYSICVHIPQFLWPHGFIVPRIIYWT